MKRVSIKHLLRKGFFFEKGFEHYLRNMQRTVSKGVPNCKHGKDQGTRNFPNIENCEVPRFCEIFCGILMSRKKIYFGKYSERISWKYLFGKIAFNFKIFLSLSKYFITRIYWAEIFEKNFRRFQAVWNWKEECC